MPSVTNPYTDRLWPLMAYQVKARNIAKELRLNRLKQEVGSRNLRAVSAKQVATGEHVRYVRTQATAHLILQSAQRGRTLDVFA